MGQRLSREPSRGSFRSSDHYHDLGNQQEEPGRSDSVYPPPRNPPPQENPLQPGRVDGWQPFRLDRTRRYSQIADNYTSLDILADNYNYTSLDQVTKALAEAGLESSNLIVGIDFTKSNEWTGRHSFNNRSLHHIGNTKNPYEQAISIIGQTLSAFDEDNLIPCFGFGDASTHDQDVFSFYPDEKICNGFSEALARYREIVPQLELAGPTSFAPIIEMAMTIVEQSGGLHHVLLIIADGQVTRSVDTESGQLSSQEQNTVDAIIKASEFPLSIILVGVGDEPWDMMKEFYDYIPTRSFDNLQFVNFTSIMSKNIPQTRKETEFALEALMKIPSQYKATLELGILGHRFARSPERVPLPPPIRSYGAVSMRSKRKATLELGILGHRHAKSPKWVTFPPPIRCYGAASVGSKTFGSTSLQSHSSPYSGYETTSTAPPATSGYETESTAPPSLSASWDNQDCPICLTNHKDMAFGCGHQTCCECGANLSTCPMCRSQIQTRIKLY